MRYISTSGLHKGDLRQVAVNCYAPDGTLYMPENIPVLPRAYLNNIGDMSLREIAYVIANTLLGDDYDSAALKRVVDASLDFPVPVKKVYGNVNMMELFHGPTLAFKDVSARFMAELLKLHDVPSGARSTMLVATTGNTGVAIADAFAHSPAMNVIVMYPRGAMSRSQLSQLAASTSNIRLIEVAGTIGQCKEMVRTAIHDESLRGYTTIASGNTSNILRILPQIAYFFHAYARVCAERESQDAITIALPCGNLSNLVAAVLAKRMGLPVSAIVAGCNANDDFVRVLDGSLPPDKVNHASRPTLARAMDSGYPTNLGRIMALYGGDLAAIRREIKAFSVSDSDIASTINDFYRDNEYLCDPHTAVALTALRRSGLEDNAVVCATAHPAKSLDQMTAITGRALELPLQLTRFMNRHVQPAKIAPTYQALKKIIIS